MMMMKADVSMVSMVPWKDAIRAAPGEQKDLTRVLLLLLLLLGALGEWRTHTIHPFIHSREALYNFQRISISTTSWKKESY